MKKILILGLIFLSVLACEDENTKPSLDYYMRFTANDVSYELEFVSLVYYDNPENPLYGKTFVQCLKSYTENSIEDTTSSYLEILNQPLYINHKKPRLILNPCLQQASWFLHLVS